MTPELLYVADPMCSWCYGFSAGLEAVRAELLPGVGVRLVMGGLAPDSEEPMDAATAAYVQRAWRAVEAATGARFEHAFWDGRNRPRRSTWPACRAVVAAGDRGPELFAAIQRAFYREARDPSDPAVLVALAVELGLGAEAFAAALEAPSTHAALAADFALRDRLGATGFPSLGIRDEAGERLLVRGWVDERTLRGQLEQAGVLGR